MRGAHTAVVVGGCAVIVGAGFAAAPPLTAGSVTVEPTASAAQGSQTFAGPPVSNLRGTYQAQITVADGTVTDVVALQAGTSAPESVQVNTMAIPKFKDRVLEAQSWDVDAVSGASFTSPAFLESLEGAFEAAGLK
jgi:uncharacterized protein with FMN-binding domain